MHEQLSHQTLKRLEVTPVARLALYPRNARTHSRKQIRQIAESIRRFGFTNPVLIDDANQIIAGHGRVEAAKLIGLADVPTLKLSHLSEVEKRAYILADNRLAEKAAARSCCDHPRANLSCLRFRAKIRRAEGE